MAGKQCYFLIAIRGSPKCKRHSYNGTSFLSCYAVPWCLDQLKMVSKKFRFFRSNSMCRLKKILQVNNMSHNGTDICLFCFTCSCCVSFWMCVWLIGFEKFHFLKNNPRERQKPQKLVEVHWCNTREATILVNSHYWIISLVLQQSAQLQSVNVQVLIGKVSRCALVLQSDLRKQKKKTILLQFKMNKIHGLSCLNS